VIIPSGKKINKSQPNLQAGSPHVKMKLLDLPAELIDEIIAQLVVSVGIRKAVLYRSVCRSFNSALAHAICIAQVVDVYHPFTPGLSRKMHSGLLSKILARKAMTPERHQRSFLAVIANIVAELRSLAIGLAIDITDDRWFEHVAEVVANEGNSQPFPDAWSNPDAWSDESRLKNLLSGVAILGIEELFMKLSEKFEGLSLIVNNGSHFFREPLTIAAARGHVGIVRRLLALGASLELDACEVDEVRSSQFWRSRGHDDAQAEFDIQDSYMQRSAIEGNYTKTALESAARGGHREMLELLLESAYRIPITSIEYYRAIVAAAEIGRPDLMDILFSTIGKSLGVSTALDSYIICAAVRGGHLLLVESLIEAGVDINGVNNVDGWDTGRPPGTVSQAAAKGNIPMLRFLLERGALAKYDEDYGEEPQPLSQAAEHGQMEAIHLLLDFGVDPERAMLKCIQSRRPSLVKGLMERYPGLIQKEDGWIGQCALRHAVDGSTKLDYIDFLLAAGVPLNAGYDNPQCIPLNTAKDTPSVLLSTIDYLIARGAEPTDEEMRPRKTSLDRYGVLISEESRQWTQLC
jgi:ankyrin repeat protein